MAIAHIVLDEIKSSKKPDFEVGAPQSRPDARRNHHRRSPEPEVKWHPLARLVFILSTSLILWGLILLVVLSL